MDIYVYSDESGVFDKEHETFFVFGGVIFLGKDKNDEQIRLYVGAEKNIRKSNDYQATDELKAVKLLNKHKAKLYRSLNKCYKFGVVVCLNKVLDTIYCDKRSKQRYLDYVYKIAIKRAFEKMMSDSAFQKEQVENIIFYVDEHTTATNGRYELEEALLQEFKNGTHNWNFRCFYAPLFPNVHTVKVKFCDSKTKPLIHAADIVANRLYYFSNSETKNWKELCSERFHIIEQP